MKARVKFSKRGPVKYVGHLDMMRYFQKTIRRAQIPIAYSEGYNPHMIMSFAAPLGVGTQSDGEYFDMILQEPMASREMCERLNATMAEGIQVVNIVEVEDTKATNAMSLVAAADYEIVYEAMAEAVAVRWAAALREFAAQETIEVLKKTKRSESLVDIRPFIYEISMLGNVMHMKLAAGSVNHTKPELVLAAFMEYTGESAAPQAFQLIRNEIYAATGEPENPQFVSLDALGSEIIV
ncbi:MAG: TIGR03936 family radical SAM-associated protein [Lachnospiraceae bacterium]